MMLATIQGATAMGFWVASLFFWQYYRQSKDRFFALFAGAFFVMAANRVAIALLGPDSEHLTLAYLLRLASFVVIIVAIVDKNRSAK